MTLNATIIVQIINFLIGYWLISNFLLKPVYNVLKNEEHYKFDLQKQLTQEVDKVEDKQLIKRKAWRSCQTFFNSERPHVENAEDNVVSNASISTEPLDAKEVEKIEQDIVRALKSKILEN